MIINEWSSLKLGMQPAMLRNPSNPLHPQYVKELRFRPLKACGDDTPLEAYIKIRNNRLNPRDPEAGTFSLFGSFGCIITNKRGCYFVCVRHSLPGEKCQERS